MPIVASRLPGAANHRINAFRSLCVIGSAQVFGEFDKIESPDCLGSSLKPGAGILPSGRQILPGSLRFTKIVNLGLGAIYGGGFAAMELTTILNRCHRFRGFVYEHARFSADKKSIEMQRQCGGIALSKNGCLHPQREA